jgi:hypothetical protein
MEAVFAGIPAIRKRHKESNSKAQRRKVTARQAATKVLNLN